MNYQTKDLIFKFVMISLVLLFAIVSIFVGVQSIGLNQIFNLTENQRIILFTSRIPRTVALVISGASLSLAGLLMQQISQNRFVSPTTAGTIDSARLGVVFAMIFFSGTAFVQQIIFAFIFAVAGTFIFTLFLRSMKRKNSIMIPLVGIMYGNILGSIGTYFALRYEIVQNITSFLQGNFSLISSENYGLLYLAIPVFFLIYFFAHYFTVMGLGKDVATELGMPYHLIETIAVVLISLVATTVLLTVGNVPFIGIVIPNLITLKQGDHFKKNIFPTVTFGAVFLLLADILARTINYPYEIPVSVIVGIVGSAIFLFLLLRGESNA